MYPTDKGYAPRQQNIIIYVCVENICSRETPLHEDNTYVNIYVTNVDRVKNFRQILNYLQTPAQPECLWCHIGHLAYM